MSNPTAAATPSSSAATQSGSPLRRTINLGYIGYDLRRNIRMFSSIFFVVVLPVMLYLIFGALSDYSDFDLQNGRGNVSSQIMVSMAAYGAITATVSLAGAAAVELQQGWGRQLGLTPFTRSGFVVSKVVVALTIAVLPVIAVFITGALTNARLEPWLWPVLGLLCVAGSVVFAFYGLAFGLLFRSEAAVGAASGLIVILMFAGNAFFPLSGFLLDLAPFTPVWGVMQLAQWPLTDGTSFSGTSGDVIQYALWQPIVNVVVWATVFGLLGLWGARRHTGRG